MSDEAAQRTRTGVLGWALTGAGAAMVPWMYVLATRLPSTTEVSNWSTAWVGLDAMLAAGLVSTGVLLRRKDSRHTLTAAATASLLVMDAWFDVTTSAGGAERATAVALAAGVELPLAALCAALAVRGLRRPHRNGTHRSGAHRPVTRGVSWSGPGSSRTASNVLKRQSIR
ncbi:hypothetical protein [Actinomadura rudentiformis]|uniref:hypothetical protein n=1 Tax=Actinomadura rudentiformis TaxID=359158 RepID=UPI001CEF9AC7|nr:hypothetical protein [Actinomadura rudentiformis]